MRLQRQCGLHTTLIMKGLLANLYIWVSGLLLLQKRSSNPGRHTSIHNLLISIALILHTYNVMFAWGYTTENNMEEKNLFCLKYNTLTHKPTHTHPQNPAHALPRFLGCHSTAVPRNVVMLFHYPVSLDWHALTLHQPRHNSHSTTHESKQRSTASTPISKGFLQTSTDLLASCNQEMLAEILGLANRTIEKNCDPEWWTAHDEVKSEVE